MGDFLPDAFANVAIQPDKLPTKWRDLWLSLPKWFRIGCWAAMACFLFYVVIAIRIGIGLIESPEIQRIRQEGGIVLYPWRNTPVPFRRYMAISDGLWGRSARNVHAVIMPKKNAENVNRRLKEFPNLKVVVLTDLAIQVNENHFEIFCLMMMQTYTTPPPVVIGCGNEYGKPGWKRLDLPQ